VEVEMTADHGISQSFYFLDPDGNRLEFYSQVMTPVEGKQYLRDATSAADALRPLDLDAVV
jgi:catechol-2,3-dioxygenase